MRTKILSILLILLILVGMGYIYVLKNQLQEIKAEVFEEKGRYPEIYNHLLSITYPQFQSKIENRENFIIYVGRPTCEDCNEFEPKFIEIIHEREITEQIIYLNVANIRKSEKQWKVFKEAYEINYTPTIAKYEQGKLQSKVEWTPERGFLFSEFEKWLEKIEGSESNGNCCSNKSTNEAIQNV